MPSRSSITPSPGTMARSAATISARRPRMSGSRAGICMPRSLRQTKRRRKPKPPPPNLMPVCDRALALSRALALAALIARVGLVDDVDAALAAHDAAILVAQLHGLERVADLHDSYSTKSPGRAGVKFRKRAENRDGMSLRQPSSRIEFPNDLSGLGAF